MIKVSTIVVSANSKTRVNSIDLSISIQVCAESVTSHLSLVPRPPPSFPSLFRTASDGKLGGGLGMRLITSRVPRKACWGEFSITIYGNIAYVQMAAAFAYRRIPSCLDADVEMVRRQFGNGIPSQLS